MYFAYGVLFIASLFEIFGDYFLKRWSSENHHLFLIGGLFIYALSTLFWAFSLKSYDLSKLVIVFNIMTTVLVVLMGVFIFKEELSSLNKLGLALAIAALILVDM